jgi:diguanylate cyclase (GGDEF)-like protein
MSLGDAIERLEEVVAEVRQTSLTDDKTTLGSALALRREERLIDEGVSEFDVIVFGDLNDFKSLNDEHGYEAGDLAIRTVGETIYRIAFEELQAKAFRQSGDEFVILLKQAYLKRFLLNTPAFDGINFSHNEKELKTAMSFGYVLSDGKTSFRELLGRAEAACKQAKTLADGACVLWTEDVRLNPFVRKSERCQNCGARTSCNVPKQNAPVELICCPCCGKPFKRMAKTFKKRASKVNSRRK